VEGDVAILTFGVGGHKSAKFTLGIQNGRILFQTGLQRNRPRIYNLVRIFAKPVDFQNP
jgi:hypothetical protein